MSPPRFQFTLRHLMWLVAVCAIASALLTTLAAPLVLAIAMIVPGFVIERIRGGTGIIGGTISGCMITTGLVAVFCVLAYYSGNGSFEGLLSTFPSLYLLFVLSLVWSGLASMLLHLSLRALERRSSKLNAIDPPGEAIVWLLPDDSTSTGIRWVDSGKPGVPDTSVPDRSG